MTDRLSPITNYAMLTRISLIVAYIYHYIRYILYFHALKDYVSNQPTCTPYYALDVAALSHSLRKALQ